jgi:Domain of unknown function (DUF397)
VAAPDLTTAQWRTSSFSGNNGTCVQIATLPNGRIAVRNSNHPEDGIILSTHTEINAWITRIKTGELDNPT